MKKPKQRLITYIIELEYPADNKTIIPKVDRLIEALKDTFMERFPSSLINMKVDKVDLEKES